MNDTAKASRFSKETLEAAVLKRAQHATVERYLAALEDLEQARVTDPEQLRSRLAELNAEIQGAPSRVKRVELVQERLNIEKQLARLSNEDSFQTIEEDFVKIARDWATRKGITYDALRLSGVPASVLKRAKITR